MRPKDYELLVPEPLAHDVDGRPIRVGDRARGINTGRTVVVTEVTPTGHVKVRYEDVGLESDVQRSRLFRLIEEEPDTTEVGDWIVPLRAATESRDDGGCWLLAEYVGVPAQVTNVVAYGGERRLFFGGNGNPPFVHDREGLYVEIDPPKGPEPEPDPDPLADYEPVTIEVTVPLRNDPCHGGVEEFLRALLRDAIKDVDLVDIDEDAYQHLPHPDHEAERDAVIAALEVRVTS